MTRKDNMKRLLNRMWTEDDGVLSFEWTLLVTLLTIISVGALFLVVGYMLLRGLSSLDVNFFIKEPKPAGEVGGGIVETAIRVAVGQEGAVRGLANGEGTGQVTLQRIREPLATLAP